MQSLLHVPQAVRQIASLSLSPSQVEADCSVCAVCGVRRHVNTVAAQQQAHHPLGTLIDPTGIQQRGQTSSLRNFQIESI
jgi:hypothetical protein